ncbi:MAG: DUF2330 domain-containing protein [Candidatus Krumholzibacteriota bacterium]
MRNSIYSLLTVLAVLAALVLIPPPMVYADGGFLFPQDAFMYEPVQRALIDYDSENHTEHLSIQPGFRGDARAFAWIVPVPNLPELTLADKQLFWDLDALTRPVHRSRDGDWDCWGNRGIYSPDYADGGFEIHSSQLVGYYQTLVLSATEAPELLEFLTTLGFLHEDNLESATTIINDYVERSWYFVAMQVDSTALAEINPGGYYGYYSGNLDPIRLAFASDEIIYPMKISAMSAADVSTVHLYVKTDHRMTFSGASTHYANRFSAGELNELSRFTSLRSIFQPGDFLTKLQRGYLPEQMVEDIILAQAATDDEFHLIIYGGFPWTGILLISMPVAVALKRRFWIRRE